MATVTVGYNRRTWATFQVIDATPAELATLAQADSEEAATLARELDAADRLVLVSETADDNPDRLSELADANVVDATDDDA